MPAPPASPQIRPGCAPERIASPTTVMITSLVPMAFALVTAASPAAFAPDLASVPDTGPVIAADAPGLQGQQQNPPQKQVEKGAPETTKRKGGAYEGEPLRNRGLRSVPPVAGENFVSSHVTVMRELGVVIAGADPKIVYVSSVLPSGVGSQVDIRPNDVILTLNGQTIQTTQAFQTRFNRLPNGSPVEIGLRRGSQRFAIAFYKPSERTNSRPTIPNDRPGPILPD